MTEVKQGSSAWGENVLHSNCKNYPWTKKSNLMATQYLEINNHDSTMQVYGNPAFLFRLHGLKFWPTIYSAV